MSDANYKFDVFLSHSVADIPEVAQIAGGLRKAGLKVWLFNGTSAGTADLDSYEARSGLMNSRVLLLFISEYSEGPPWAKLEAHTLSFRDPANRERRFIPIRIGNAAVPGALRHIECIDWRPEQSEEIIARLAAVCQPPVTKPSARGIDVPRLSSKIRHRLGPTTGMRVVKLDLAGRSASYGERNGDICFIDIDEPSIVKNRLVGNHGAITGLAFHKSSPLLLTISVERTAHLWSVLHEKCEREFSGDFERISAVGFAGDAPIICSMDGTIHIWNDVKAEIPDVFRGHSGAVYCIQSLGNTLVSAGADGTVRTWRLGTGQCLRVLEGHVSAVRCLALNASGTHLLTGSDDRTVRLWDLVTGVCSNVFDAHTDSVKCVAWHPLEHVFVSGGGDRTLRLWNIETGKPLRIFDGHDHDVLTVAFGMDVLLSADSEQIYEWKISSSLVTAECPQSGGEVSKATDQVQYTNAKVLLVGDSGAGKTGLSKRLAGGQWEPSAASTVGAWATQWSIPASNQGHGEREIWLWDFGGQADQRLIHQLYMDETALAVLVFDAQRTEVFETLTQWDRDIARSTDAPVSKLLVAGRIDASPVRVSRQDIDDYVREHGFAQYLETSALTNAGCDELRDAIVGSIDWTNIPWRSSPVLFKRLKEEIVKLKDEGRILMRFNELRDALRLRLPEKEINFADAELKAVLSLLSGPGVVVELEFGAWVLFQPELINAYGQAVIATMRADPSELGCVSEQRVLNGDLVYGDLKRIARDDERFVLLEMHRKLLQRGLCAKELTEKDVLLVFPSYYKRNRPELTGHPDVLVSYQFDGVVDEIYSTLVVRLNHTHTFRRNQLWQDAAEFTAQSLAKIGIKLDRQVKGVAAAIEVYCDAEASLADKIIFVKYVHDHLLQRATNVVRRRHYVCTACLSPIADHSAAEKRRKDGKEDIGCPTCDARVRLVDDLEQQYLSVDYQRVVRRLDERANEELSNESKERVLVGEVMSTAALAGQIAREKSVSDYGIDMEIEFKDNEDQATGALIFLQLKSGDSHLRTSRDGKEIFQIKNARHAKYWADQIAPVMLVIRTSDGSIRWMEIRELLREKLLSEKAVTQIEFKGERFDAPSVSKWRKHMLDKSRRAAV